MSCISAEFTYVAKTIMKNNDPTMIIVPTVFPELFLSSFSMGLLYNR
jgi:hypothetical protein